MGGALAAVAVITMGAKGCGSTASVNTSPVNTTPATASSGTAATTPATAAPATAAPTTVPAVAHVGSALAVEDSQSNKGTVTLVQVIDPAQGSDSYTTPDAGKRFVGAKFTVAGTAGTLKDDANNDATLIGSDGQTYTADFNDIAGCTNFDGGSFTVASGSSSTGCVVFQVPTGVTVAKVRFDINGGFGNSIAEWKVP